MGFISSFLPFFFFFGHIVMRGEEGFFAFMSSAISRLVPLHSDSCRRVNEESQRRPEERERDHQRDTLAHVCVGT